MDVTVRPLTPDLWPALEEVFGPRGACNGCWCMYWRIGSAYRKRSASDNKAAFREIVEEGPPPGLLAFDGDLAIGWCQLTPRHALPWLDRTWRLERVDDVPVWSITCMYVRKEYRRQGVTSALIAAAIKAAKRAKAPALEAYPLDATKTTSSSSLSGSPPRQHRGSLLESVLSEESGARKRRDPVRFPRLASIE